VGLVSLISETIDQAFDAVQAGAIDGFSIGSGRHIPGLGVDTLVSQMEDVFPEKVAVQTAVLVGGVQAAFGQTV
jgi:hypothetical protein